MIEVETPTPTRTRAPRRPEMTVAEQAAFIRANAPAWRKDPVRFVEDVLVDPLTRLPFVLYEAQKRFLREAFRLDPDGRLTYTDTVFGAPKKSGKSATGAMAAIYLAVVLAGEKGEVYALAADLDQASERVFEAIVRMIQASPILRSIAKITTGRVEIRSTGTFIQAVANDYASFAGGNPSLCIFDELWTFKSERDRRLWEEALPSPVRKISARMVVSHAGFEGEESVLEDLYRRGIQGEEIAPGLYRSDGLLFYWTNESLAPWQNDKHFATARRSLRANQYLRMIENRWVTAESTFIPLDEWDACTDANLHPILTDQTLPIWIGLDASMKHDYTALVATTWDTDGRVRLVCSRVFKPSPTDPINFEGDIERTVLEWKRAFDLKLVVFDPYQMQGTQQRLTRMGVPMFEYVQSGGNLTEIGQGLLTL